MRGYPQRMFLIPQGLLAPWRNSLRIAGRHADYRRSISALEIVSDLSRRPKLRRPLKSRGR